MNSKKSGKKKTNRPTSKNTKPMNNRSTSKKMSTKKKTTKRSPKKEPIKTNTDNVVKIKTEFESKNFIYTKKLRLLLIVTTIIFVVLVGKIGVLQFVDSAKLKEEAYNQQVINQIISPKRGNIYDATGKALAISAQVDTITINPTKIKKSKEEETPAYKELVAKGLADIFELPYEEVFEKVNANSQVETIIKKVEQDKVDQLRTWMSDNKITVGINIDEDTKRYYPYGNVASSVIGFSGNDNQGLSGIESKWDSVLTGTPGKIVSSKGSDQKEIPNAEEKYISAENGSDLTLTIDLNIQNIAEKYLKQAVDDNDCRRGGNVIVMEPKTGDILAMASYPDYNLNTPYTPNETLAKTYDQLSAQEKSDALFKMWGNKSVTDTYEPGSTFKIITSAIAIEENISKTDTAGEFYCKGYESFSDVNDKVINIKCWRAEPHGMQSLRDSLKNSCNPAFMQLGKKIGTPTLYKYFNAFGLFNSTDSGLSGEQSSIFQPQEKVGPVEQATISFGQRFNVTPLQLITAVSSIANDGMLMKPRIVKELKNTETNSTSEQPTTQVRQVVSKQTAAQVKSMMESVVTTGTGRHAAVSGYSIGGKTGTSEPPVNREEEGYVASYVAISPVEDTKVVLLLTLYDPNGKNGHQGGQVAGPVVSQMLSEILPYLDIPSDNTASSNTNASNLVLVPDVRNKTVTEAEKILKDAGFNVKIHNTGDANTVLVTDQNPKPGSSLPKGATMVLYGEGNSVSTSMTVPDLNGLGASQAAEALKNNNLNINIEGSGTVITQDPSKGEKVPEGTIVNVTLKQTLRDAQ